MGSQHWRGVLRGREVRLHVVGEGNGNGNCGGRPQRSGAPVRAARIGLKNEKETKCVSERVSMCERCVCPNLFICCTGWAIATAWRCSVVSR